MAFEPVGRGIVTSDLTLPVAALAQVLDKRGGGPQVVTGPISS